jgi:hypothetical protein
MVTTAAEPTRPPVAAPALLGKLMGAVRPEFRVDILVPDRGALVFDAATLQYWAAKQGKGIVQVVGPTFRPQKYAIAVAVGSALRKQINRALLEIYADGTYEKIYSAWFSVVQ